MFFSVPIFAAALSTISLDGMVAGDITSRADFDAYNVYAGDPMELIVDFTGEADFFTLHPPRISEVVDSSVWKVDDKSANTVDYRAGRRITYRVKPLKEGCLEFPGLTFSYKHYKTGKKVKISTCAIPVHSKKSSQVELSLTEEEKISAPLPDGILIDLTDSPWGSGNALDDDGLFAWQKACLSPKAEAFKEFDFPEARLNEAACEILAGNWQRALDIYSSLEWKIGQTPAIERGIVAAIALKTSNPDAELPVWRRLLRPVLKYSWVGRLWCALGLILVVAGLFFASRILLKRMVCLVAAVVFSQAAFAQEMSLPEITAKVETDKTKLVVGETFNMTVSFDTPKDCTLSEIRLEASKCPGLMIAGKSENLPDEPGRSVDRVLKRMTFPLRCSIPFNGDIGFSISGMCGREVRGSYFVSQSYRSFSADAGSLKIEVKCLDGVKTPHDYNGCVGERFVAYQRLDGNGVETNDVIGVIVRVDGENAFIPDDAFDFVLGRRRNCVEYKTFFRADGSPATSDISFSYYDPGSKTFKRATAKGVIINYVPSKEREIKDVVVDNGKSRMIPLRFSPSESAEKIALINGADEKIRILESYGVWVRVDDGVHAGWVKKRDLKNE